MNENKNYKIMLYGLHEKQVEIIKEHLVKCVIFNADCWQDIIAVSADLIILNPIKISAEGIEVITQFYKDIEPAPEKIIVTEHCEKLEQIKNIECIEYLFEEPYKLKAFILRGLHETMKDVDYSRRISLSLLIMKCICNKTGITTKQLAERTELSERSIKRYIDTLRMAGADIVYEDKGWHCKIALWDY